MTTIDRPADATIDPEAMGAAIGHAAGQATAAVNGVMVALGDRLGIWKAMAGAGPLTSDMLAERTGLDERHLREWLAAQASNGFLAYDASTNSFALSTEHAMVLADEDSPALLIGAFQGVASVGRMLPALETAFRSGDGLAWHDRDPELFDVQERFSRPLQRGNLIDVWLAAVPGLAERLAGGATIADVGCGYGGSSVLLAEAYPESRVTGFDFHDHSIVQARNAARRAGVGDRVSFEVADAALFPGTYDVVLLIDALHDMGDPVAVVRHVRSALAPGGVLVVLDPASADSLVENLANPMAGMLYAVSTFLCTPTAASQHGPHVLGALGGEGALRRVLEEGGFTDVQRVAPDAPFNMVLVARD